MGTNTDECVHDLEDNKKEEISKSTRVHGEYSTRVPGYSGENQQRAVRPYRTDVLAFLVAFYRDVPACVLPT